MNAAVLDLHFLAADIHHIELCQKFGIETDGIELDLTFDAVGIDDLPYGDIFYAHTLFSFSVSRRYYSEIRRHRQVKKKKPPLFSISLYKSYQMGKNLTNMPP